jgi:hypothetical protein
MLTQFEINSRDSDRARNERIERAGEYASGFCSCCGSDDGLDEDGNPCGWCAEGIRQLEN